MAVLKNDGVLIDLLEHYLSRHFIAHVHDPTNSPIISFTSKTEAELFDELPIVFDENCPFEVFLENGTFRAQNKMKPIKVVLEKFNGYEADMKMHMLDSCRPFFNNPLAQAVALSIIEGGQEKLHKIQELRRSYTFSEEFPSSDTLLVCSGLKFELDRISKEFTQGGFSSNDAGNAWSRDVSFWVRELGVDVFSYKQRHSHRPWFRSAIYGYRVNIDLVSNGDSLSIFNAQKELRLAYKI